MCILRSVEGLQGFSVIASGCVVGHVSDVCLDDRNWSVRRLTVNIAGSTAWLSPAALQEIDWRRRALQVARTMQQARNDAPGSARNHVLHRGEGEAAEQETPEYRPRDSPLLRSGEVVGCDVHAENDAIGHIDALLFDSESWKIEAMVVDTRNWWPGRKIVLAPERIVRASWKAMIVVVDVTRAQVETNPDEYDPAGLPMPA